MRSGDVLHLAGALLLLVGLVTALVSNHRAATVMGKAQLGVAVLAPQEGSPEWKEKERLRASADRWFWTGLVLTAAGILLQTAAPYLPARRNVAAAPVADPQGQRPVWFLGAPWLFVSTGLPVVGLLFWFWVPAMPLAVVQTFPAVPADRWGRLLALYVFTMFGSHVVTFFSLVGLRRLAELAQPVEYEARNAWLPILVGFCESILYPTAWLVGRLEFIGFWIALKTAGQWKAWQNGDDHQGRRRFLVFLIGSALSLLFASLGFWFMKVFVLTAADGGGPDL